MTTLSSAACALLALVLFACGGGGQTSSRPSGSRPALAAAALPRIVLQGDDDLDSDRYPHEADEENVPFGHPAPESDARALAAVVRRYYADAARTDGAAACRLLYATRAETVAQDYHDALGHGRSGRLATCAVTLSALFRHRHRRLSADSATLKVGAVRVEFNTASVQLRFGRARPAEYIEGHRERGAWKLGMVLAEIRPLGME